MAKKISQLPMAGELTGDELIELVQEAESLSATLDQLKEFIGFGGAAGPVSFSDLSGDIQVSQMHGGINASSSTYWRGDGIWNVPPGGGDVAGPISSVNNRVVFFSGTTGKVLKDSGLLLSGNNTGDQDLSELIVGPGSVVNNRVALFSGTTGKVLKDSGLLLSGSNTGDQDLSGLVPKTTTVNGYPLSGNISITASDIGLGSVTDNAQIKASDFPNSSVDSEVALFSGAGGKTIKRAGGTGIAILSGGVLGITANNSSNWNSAFTDRLKWDGGATGLDAVAGRVSLLGTVANRGLAKVIYISARPDSITGKGTAEDPFNGGTTSVTFDALMAAQVANTIFYFAANTLFKTKGRCNWNAKSGWQWIVPQTTTIQLDVITAGDVTAMGDRTASIFTSGSTLIEDVVIDGGIWDINLIGQTEKLTPSAINLIADGVTIRNTKIIGFGSTNAEEAFPIVIGAADASRIYRKGVLIENNKFTAPYNGGGTWPNNGQISIVAPATGYLASGNTPGVGWFENAVVRNNYFYDIDVSTTVPISVCCINFGAWLKNFHSYGNHFDNITDSVNHVVSRYGYYCDTGSWENIVLENDVFSNVAVGINILNSPPPWVRSKLHISNMEMDGITGTGIGLSAHMSSYISDVTIDDCYILGTNVGMAFTYCNGVRLRRNTLATPTSVNSNAAASVIFIERYGNCDGSGNPIAATINVPAEPVGTAFLMLASPSAITFPRVNANNTVDLLSAASFRTAIGAGSMSITVATDTIWDALGDLVYGTGADTGAKLTGNTTATKKFLTQTGNGSISAVPSWNTIVIGDIPDLSSTYGLTTNSLSQFAATTSAQLAGVLSDETGFTIGAKAVFNINPSFLGATIDGDTLTIKGNQSKAAWTTSGIRIISISGTLTDTTSSGTVATAYTNKLGGNTIAANSSVTFTNYISTYFVEPTAGTNVTFTNKWALGADSMKIGTDANALKVSTLGVLTAINALLLTPKIGSTGTGLAENSTGVLQVNNGTINQWGALKVGVHDSGTNTITSGLTIGHQSTGTPAVGLGSALVFKIDSTTTQDQTAAQIAAVWTTATHATRTADLVFYTVNSSMLVEAGRFTGVGDLTVVGDIICASNFTGSGAGLSNIPGTAVVSRVEESRGLFDSGDGAILTVEGTDLTFNKDGGLTSVVFDSGSADMFISGLNTTATSSVLQVNNIGSSVQAWDAQLDTWSGIAPGVGVGTALALNVGTDGAFVTFNGGLGTPLSGTVTNLTGTASININGTVGATTPAAGTFTTLVAGSTTSLLLGTAGSAVGNIGFRNATSGTATLAPPTGALGTYTVILPTAASIMPIFGQQITFSGPTAARTVTLPDANFTAARTDAANSFTGVQTMTSPALTTPAITGLATGSGVASAATASTLAARDANANLLANNWLGGYTTTATAAGTTTLTVGSTYAQFFTGSTTQTVTLPVASTLALGHQFVIANNSTGVVTINSSGANKVVDLVGSTSVIVTCILASGTTAASWSYSYLGNVVASGKKLSVSNTLTLAGTDATTMTFPSTSATIARTDAANTFTGHQTIEGVASTGATGTGKFVFDTLPTLTSLKLSTGLIYPTSNSTTAIQMTAANGTTVITNLDTTNARFGVGITTPRATLDVYGTSTNPTSANPNYGQGIFRVTGSSTVVIDLGTQAGSPYAGWVQAYDQTNGASVYPLLLQPLGGGVAIGASTDPGTNNLSVAGIIKAGAQVRLKGYTVSTLPSGTVGDTAYVTDALAPSFLGTLVGGGAITTPAFYNGTNWVGF